MVGTGVVVGLGVAVRLVVAVAGLGVVVGLGIAADVRTGVAGGVDLDVSVAMGWGVASTPEQAKAAIASIADAIIAVIFFMVVNLSGSDWPDSP